jgi:hypothetical protein
MTTTNQPMVVLFNSAAGSALSFKRRISLGELLTCSLPPAENARAGLRQSIDHHAVEPMVTSLNWPGAVRENEPDRVASPRTS